MVSWIKGGISKGNKWRKRSFRMDGHLSLSEKVQRFPPFAFILCEPIQTKPICLDRSNWHIYIALCTNLYAF